MSKVRIWFLILLAAGLTAAGMVGLQRREIAL
jgi:hypothetical protein